VSHIACDSWQRRYSEFYGAEEGTPGWGEKMTRLKSWDFLRWSPHVRNIGASRAALFLLLLTVNLTSTDQLLR